MPAGLARYYEQRLEWEDCERGIECAELVVPFTYADLGVQNDQYLSVYRLTARGTKKGSLVIHRSGTGSHVRYAAAELGEDLIESFDIVGFDPRGRGGPTTMRCLPGHRLDAYFERDDSPDTAAEWTALRSDAKDLADTCDWFFGPDFLASLSDENAARDLDILLSALGEPKLNLFAQSVGATLGVTYAKLFPQRVGRIVLDSPERPGLSMRQYALDQAAEFEAGLKDFLSYCVDFLDCVLGDTAAEASKELAALVNGLEAKPIEGDDDRKLSRTLAVIGLRSEVAYGSWDRLNDELADALEGDGAALMRRADDEHGRADGDGTYATYLDTSLAARCLARPSIPAGQIPSFAAELRQASPILGPVLLREVLPCTYWPAPPAKPVPYPPPSKLTEHLVIASSAIDPIMPGRWADRLVKELPHGHLLRPPVTGHLTYGVGDDCVDAAIEAFLLSGTLPRSGQCDAEDDGGEGVPASYQSSPSRQSQTRSAVRSRGVVPGRT